MTASLRRGVLSVGFLEAATAATEPVVVSVPDLTRVLDAVQGAVYVTAAYELDLNGPKSLSDEQRRQYTLAIAGYRQGSLWTDLVPLIAVSITAASQQMSLFSPEVMRELAAEAIMRTWSTVGRTIDVMLKQFRGEEDDPRVDRGIGRHTAAIAQTALKNGQTIEIIDREPNGSEHILRTSYAGNVRVLSRAAVLRGKLQEYPDCTIRDIMTSQPSIRAEVPEYHDSLVRCTYERGREHEFAERLHVGERVTIFGIPIWSDRKGESLVPESIELAFMINSAGEIIGQPTLQQLLVDAGPDDMPAA